MAVSLSHSTGIIEGELSLSSSKSESNRALIIRALCADHFEIQNLSDANDTVVLEKLLSSNDPILDVGLAGTAMRFLTAYMAIGDKEVKLTGDSRMKERPIHKLVDVLRELGANIDYVGKEGFPPLRIRGKELNGEEVTIDGGVSSQYISALLMIAPKLKNGLQIQLLGEIVSRPYIEMTVKMMRYFGATIRWEDNVITVEPKAYTAKGIAIEPDWSAASYWYSMVALANEADLTLLGLKEESLQGDAVVQEIYKNFGVNTEYVKDGIHLTKHSAFSVQHSGLEIDFVNFPDIAPTVAVTCAALNVPAKLTGLKTLRIKETDRILALQTELHKLGYDVEINGDDLQINHTSSLKDISDSTVKTYNDHRMAMAFAPLAMYRTIAIEDEDVVAKSYPNFWKDLQRVGFTID